MLLSLLPLKKKTYFIYAKNTKVHPTKDCKSVKGSASTQGVVITRDTRTKICSKRLAPNTQTNKPISKQIKCCISQKINIYIYNLTVLVHSVICNAFELMLPRL